MDPDEALAQLRLIVGRLHNFLEAEDVTEFNIEPDLDALLLHFGGLDEWLSNGGYLPSPWHANVRHS